MEREYTLFAENIVLYQRIILIGKKMYSHIIYSVFKEEKPSLFLLLIILLFEPHRLRRNNECILLQ